MDDHLKELCIAVLLDRVGGDRFNRLLLETGVCLESPEWDMANKILEKGDEMKSSLGRNPYTLH